MKFGEKLKAVRLAKGMSQDELARLLGTTKQAISRYENSDRDPNLRTAREFSRVLGIDINILADDTLYLPVGEKVANERRRRAWSLGYFSDLTGITEDRLQAIECEDAFPEGFEVKAIADALCCSIDWLYGFAFQLETSLPSNVSQLPKRRPTVPLVGQIACGIPILAEENIESYVELPEHVRADYALTCKGDSMINAGIRDGDVVYIRQQEEVENGQIAAVMVDDGDATLKRFYHDGSTVTLIAENPSVPPMVFSGEDINRLRVIGLAVAYIHLLEK